jgi:hypothetical protein
MTVFGVRGTGASDEPLTWRIVRGSIQKSRVVPGVKGPARPSGRRTLAQGQEAEDARPATRNGTDRIENAGWRPKGCIT